MSDTFKTKEEELNFLLGHEGNDPFGIDTALDDDDGGSVELRRARVSVPLDDATSHKSVSIKRRSLSPATPPLREAPRTTVADWASLWARLAPPELQQGSVDFSASRVVDVETAPAATEESGFPLGHRRHGEYATVTPRLQPVVPQTSDADTAWLMKEDEELLRLAPELQEDFSGFDFDSFTDIGCRISRSNSEPIPAVNHEPRARTRSDIVPCNALLLPNGLENSKESGTMPVETMEDKDSGSWPAAFPALHRAAASLEFLEDRSKPWLNDFSLEGQAGVGQRNAVASPTRYRYPPPATHSALSSATPQLTTCPTALPRDPSAPPPALPPAERRPGNIVATRKAHLARIDKAERAARRARRLARAKSRVVHVAGGYGGRSEHCGSPAARST